MNLTLDLGYHVSLKHNMLLLDKADLTLSSSAQWLRDTGNQFAHLYKLLPQDDNLQALVKGVINTEARYISEYPYCGRCLEARVLECSC